MEQNSKVKKGIGSTVKQFIFFGSLAAMTIVFVFLSVKNLTARSYSTTDGDLPKEVQSSNLRKDPHVREVKEAKLLRELNPAVYKDVEDGDMILEYEDKIVIYRAEGDFIVKTIRK